MEIKRHPAFRGGNAPLPDILIRQSVYRLLTAEKTDNSLVFEPVKLI